MERGETGYVTTMSAIRTFSVTSDADLKATLDNGKHSHTGFYLEFIYEGAFKERQPTAELLEKSMYVLQHRVASGGIQLGAPNCPVRALK